MHILSGGFGGNYRDTAAFARKHCEDVALDAEVVGDDMKLLANSGVSFKSALGASAIAGLVAGVVEESKV